MLIPDYAILLVEHDMDAIFAVADAITVMVDGLGPRDLAFPRPSARAPRSPPHTWEPVDVATSLLEAQAVDTDDGASHVLRGVDFSVRAGEAIGLMGRNGMGKTTLIRTLLGLVRARRGRVLVRGRT